MSMNKEDGWLPYYCSICGKYAGHYRKEKPEDVECFRCLGDN